jgi:hypothetical protein
MDSLLTEETKPKARFHQWMDNNSPEIKGGKAKQTKIQ